MDPLRTLAGGCCSWRRCVEEVRLFHLLRVCIHPGTHSYLHNTHTQAAKQFARRVRARVAAEWSRRAQDQRREALEGRLMALEDERARRMRRCVLSRLRVQQGSGVCVSL